MQKIVHNITSFLHAHRLHSLILCAAVVVTMTLTALATADKMTIYFYSSETSINNFKSLKMEFDRYLSRFGPYEFQPFSDREAFEEHIRDKKQCILLLSSCHYSRIYKDSSLSAVLAGTRNGEKYQKRKCSFCVQRIHKAEDLAKSEGRELRDGEFTTACEQACPANAITFGHIDNPESLVSQLARQARGVKHLEELGTLPSVTYLKGG